MTALTREEFATSEGRRRAWRELMWSDHGWIRTLRRNEHRIAPAMRRAQQPTPNDVARWAQGGVKTVVNLRGDKPSGFYFLEEEACRKHGLKLVTFRVFSREAPSKEVLRGARALFAEIEYPAVMHCKSGSDRVGLMAALYLFFHEGLPLDRALRQLSFRYGHLRAGKTGVIDAAFGRYLAHAGERRIDLSSVDEFFRWVDSPAYDPVRIKADYMGSWWGNLLTERILRRE